MKRLLLFFLLAGIAEAKEYRLLPPHIPAPKIVEAIPPPQTHVFAALDVNNAFTGNNTHSGTETFGNLNNCFTVDGTLYTTIQAAINAAPATGCVYIPPGTYAPTSTITITKQLTVMGSSMNATVINPTSAVTGAAISINPAVQAQVVLRNFTLNMNSVPTIPAITVNNLGANSEIAWGLINLGSIGIDVTNSSVYSFHDMYITNQTTSGIRDNADGGAEHTYNNIWLINNNAAVNTASLFQYTRTNATDTGGLYLNNVRAIANVLGGTVTNGFLITSSAGSRTIIHAHMNDTICDGNFGADCVVLNNIQRMSVEGGQWGTSHVNASCAAATVSCFASVSITGSAQVDFSPNVKLVSGNRDISLSGAVDRLTVAQTQLFGGAPAGGGHIFVVTGATLTNLNILSPNYDTATVYSNNEAALIAASPTTYSNVGSGTSSGLGIGDGASATPSLFFRSDLGLGFWKSNTNTVTFNTTVSGPVFRYDNTGVSIISTFAFKPSVAGGVDLGTTALPFGNLWLGTAATNNYKIQPTSTTGARIITLSDPLSPTTVAWPLGIASGTATMTTAAITAPACGTTVTVAATGVLTTDKIDWSFNAAPAGSNAGLVSWPTAGNVNFAYCPGVTETPVAATINWSVRRP